MINLGVVLGIIVIHWIADFVFQTDWQAKNKSSNNKALLSHTFIYSIFWLIPVLIMMSGCIKPLLFFVITFITHTIIDYFTSRLNTKLWTAGKVHYFFVSIGFDQVLHYTQLLLTWYYLTN